MTDTRTDLRAEVEALKQRSRRHYKHGHTVNEAYSPTYQSWQSMIARGRYPHRDVARKYARRGITVCERWQKSFEAFLADMGERPDGTTLDRMDNAKGYEPGNCRWATPKEQARNRRNARLTLETATQVAVRHLRGESAAKIAAEYCVSESLPREIVKGRTWPDALAAAKRIIEAEND